MGAAVTRLQDRLSPSTTTVSAQLNAACGAAARGDAWMALELAFGAGVLVGHGAAIVADWEACSERGRRGGGRPRLVTEEEFRKAHAQFYGPDPDPGRVRDSDPELVLRMMRLLGFRRRRQILRECRRYGLPIPPSSPRKW